MMTIEDLKERLKSIEENLFQTRANYNALEGSRQEVLHWIAKLKEAEKLIN